MELDSEVLRDLKAYPAQGDLRERMEPLVSQDSQLRGSQETQAHQAYRVPLDCQEQGEQKEKRGTQD